MTIGSVYLWQATRELKPKVQAAALLTGAVCAASLIGRSIQLYSRVYAGGLDPCACVLAVATVASFYLAYVCKATAAVETSQHLLSLLSFIRTPDNHSLRLQLLKNAHLFGGALEKAYLPFLNSAPESFFTFVEQDGSTALSLMLDRSCVPAIKLIYAKLLPLYQGSLFEIDSPLHKIFKSCNLEALKQIYQEHHKPDPITIQGFTTLASKTGNYQFLDFLADNSSPDKLKLMKLALKRVSGESLTVYRRIQSKLQSYQNPFVMNLFTTPTSPIQPQDKSPLDRCRDHELFNPMLASSICDFFAGPIPRDPLTIEWEKAVRDGLDTNNWKSVQQIVDSGRYAYLHTPQKYQFALLAGVLPDCHPARQICRLILNRYIFVKKADSTDNGNA